MARPLRIQFAGAIYHVMSRGIEQIVTTVSSHFGQSQAGWTSGQRMGDLRRAVAAHLARRIYGYPATAVAAALGYRGHSSVHYALRLVEKEGSSLKKLLTSLEEKLSY
jgi:chromosomal replication initiation ATPase DnaA